MSEDVKTTKPDWIAVYRADGEFEEGHEWLAFVYLGKQRINIICSGSTRDEAFQKCSNLLNTDKEERAKRLEQRAKAKAGAAYRKKMKALEA